MGARSRTGAVDKPDIRERIPKCYPRRSLPNPVNRRNGTRCLTGIRDATKCNE